MDKPFAFIAELPLAYIVGVHVNAQCKITLSLSPRAPATRWTLSVLREDEHLGWESDLADCIAGVEAQSLPPPPPPPGSPVTFHRTSQSDGLLPPYRPDKGKEPMEYETVPRRYDDTRPGSS